MTEPLVALEVRPDGVAVLRLQRPPLNALSKALLEEIGAAARALASDPAVKAVVVTGNERAFAAGADINEFGSAAEAGQISAVFRAALDAIAAIPRPVIAAVRGFALGGGLELALACDLRVAGDGARLGFPELTLGIIPGAGGTQRTPRLIGPARAKELVWSGRHVKAPEAVAIGLVDRVVPDAEVEESAIAWAASFAGGAVVAMGLAKGAIDRGLDASLAEGLDVEADAFVETFHTDDASVGIASFKEHGPGKATFAGK